MCQGMDRRLGCEDLGFVFFGEWGQYFRGVNLEGPRMMG